MRSASSPSSPPRMLSEWVRLVPVIEFPPGEYATHERPLPDGPARENPDGWASYWAQSMADSGVTGLEALEPGSWLVPLTQLTEASVLRAVLRKHLEPSKPQELSGLEDERELTSFPGGHALVDGRDVLVPPGCCSDLGNVTNWQDVAEGQTGSFWNGHPMLIATLQQERLLLQEEPELASGKAAPAWSLSLSALLRAVARARQEQAALAARLAPILEEHLPPERAARFARRLAGL